MNGVRLIVIPQQPVVLNDLRVKRHVQPYPERKHDGNDTAAVTIRIQAPSQAPVVNDQTFAVAENSPDGAVVGTVLATDADSSQSLTYTITAGNNGAFAINSSTGRIIVADSALLDFETLPQVNLTVSVADNGNPSLSDTAAIRIDITDVMEITGDLKPGDSTNTLNPSTDAKFQIVLFSTVTFNANTIDVRSLRSNWK